MSVPQFDTRRSRIALLCCAVLCGGVCDIAVCLCSLSLSASLLHLHQHRHLHTYTTAGNYCVGGSQGRDPGNGRIVVAEFNGKSGDECGWEVIKTVEIPSTAYFTDYSGMAFRGDKVGVGKSWPFCGWFADTDGVGVAKGLVLLWLQCCVCVCVECVGWAGKQHHQRVKRPAHSILCWALSCNVLCYVMLCYSAVMHNRLPSSLRRTQLW